MAYDTELEVRIDGLVKSNGNLTKKKMFGGMAYLINGNMCLGIHKDHLVLRTSEFSANKWLAKNGFRPFDITGKPMRGWVMAGPDICRKPRILKSLIEEGIEYASSLPVK